MDPSGKWLMGQLPGLLLWWDQEANGSWWAWCSWAEVGAAAHGSKVRARFERLPAGCVRAALVERPPIDLGDIRPAGGGEGPG